MEKWITNENELRRDANNGRIILEESTVVEMSHHYNGSGKEHFGGAEKWPCVRCDVIIPEGKYDLQNELKDKFIKLIDDFYEENKIMEIKTND